jgi:hypothetical protein
MRQLNRRSMVGFLPGGLPSRLMAPRASSSFGSTSRRFGAGPGSPRAPRVYARRFGRVSADLAKLDVESFEAEYAIE